MILRRSPAVLLLATALPAHAQTAPRQCPAGACKGELVYVGSMGVDPGQGVTAARLDPKTGQLAAIGLALEAKRASWLVAHPTKPLLYSVTMAPPREGVATGGVLALRADTKTGRLTEIGRAGSGGGDPTHMTLDLGSGSLLVANYSTGQLAALPVGTDALPGDPTSVAQDVGTGPSPRQKGPHAHGVVLSPDRKFALVADLGADRVFVYRYGAAAHRLDPIPASVAELPPGTGPRHLAFHPDGKFLFLVSELVAGIRCYRWDAATGKLALVQTIATTADPAMADKNKGAEILVSRDGRFVYVSNRGEDTIVAYAIDTRSGKLTEVQRVASGGAIPWSMALDRSGRWMLVANQGSNSVNLFRRDVATGKLSATREALTVPKPVTIAWLSGATH